MQIERGHDWSGVGFAIGFVVIGVGALYRTQAMSPLGSIFPRTIAGALIVFAIAYIGEALLRGVEPPQQAKPGSTLRRVLLVAFMLAWASLLTILGFLASSLVGFALLSAVASYQRWTLKRTVINLLSNACVVLGFYALFTYALLVPLPAGVVF